MCLLTESTRCVCRKSRKKRPNTQYLFSETLEFQSQLCSLSIFVFIWRAYAIAFAHLAARSASAVTTDWPQSTATFDHTNLYEGTRNTLSGEIMPPHNELVISLFCEEIPRIFIMLSSVAWQKANCNIHVAESKSHFTRVADSIRWCAGLNANAAQILMIIDSSIHRRSINRLA